MPVSIALASDPYFDPVDDATFWVGKESNPIHVRGVFVPSGYTLALDENTIPPGMVVDDSRALNRFQHVYLKGAKQLRPEWGISDTELADVLAATAPVPR